MAYLYCGGCGLQMKIDAAYPLTDDCPRCLAHRAIVMPMNASPNGVAAAAGWGMWSLNHRRNGSEPSAPGAASIADADARRGEA